MKTVMEEELIKPAAVDELVIVEVKEEVLRDVEAAVELLATVKEVLAAVEGILTRV